MSEADAVALSTRGPVTREWLRRDLAALGVRPGMLLMVQASLSRLGWVIGGPITVVDALRDAVGLTDPAVGVAERRPAAGTGEPASGLPVGSPYGSQGMGTETRPTATAGTLVMPTTCGSNTEPSHWQAPAVPESWWPIVRAETPAFDPATTPSRIMGAISEYFRTLPGISRSAHPAQSWAALGPLAEQITANHSLDCRDGSDTPLGRCYQLGGHVLCLATRRTTILHLADYRCEWPGKHDKRTGSAALKDGRRQWVEYQDNWSDGEDFEQIRLDFMASRPADEGSWREGPIAYSSSRLLAIRPLVDFAIDWITRHRTASGSG